MKTMSAMDVRRHYGAVLDEVRIQSEHIILERAGKPIAMIVPIESQASQDKKSMRLQFLQQNAGSGCNSTRADDVDLWMDQIRGDRRDD